MKHFIYGLFDIKTPDVIRYVGMTTRLRSRFNTHARQLDARTASWVGSIVKSGSMIGIKVLEISNAINAGDCERKWIETFPGLLNIRHDGLPKECKLMTFPVLPLQDAITKYCAWVYGQANQNQALAARMLGVSRLTLRHRLRQNAGTNDKT